MSMAVDRLILGTGGLGGVWGKVDRYESVRTILAALQAGIGAIDTAPAYGDAEFYVGEALQQWRGKKPAISTKVGRMKSFAADQGHYDYSDAGMSRSVDDSLTILNVPILDILFLHDPEAIPRDQAERIVATLIRFKERGYTQEIGLGGNCPEWFQQFVRAGVFDVLMEFNRLNACNLAAMHDTLPFCADNHTRYFAASPLNMGLLGRKYTDYMRARPQWMPSECITAAERLAKIADTNGIVLAQLAHRFLLSLPYSFNVVIGASNMAELEDSLRAFMDGPLPDAVNEEILKLL